MTLKDGLGLRWSFMGPFETIELNAPGGIADYCARYAGSMKRIAADPATPAVFEARRTWRASSQPGAARPRRTRSRARAPGATGAWRRSRRTSARSPKH